MPTINGRIVQRPERWTKSQIVGHAGTPTQSVGLLNNAAGYVMEGMVGNEGPSQVAVAGQVPPGRTAVCVVYPVAHNEGQRGVTGKVRK